MASSTDKRKFSTRAVQAGTPDAATGAHATPIYQEQGYIYSRLGNPTTRAFEEAMASLESGEDALAFASGMAAISSLSMTLLEPGDEALLLGPLYGGTEGLYLDVMQRLGVKVTTVTEEELPEALGRKPRLLYLETPTNPTLAIRDLEKIAGLARQHGVMTIVDNTFSTPYITRPLEFGIDVVLHSATKYLGGHGDALGGVLVGSAQLMQDVRLEGLRHLGGALGPLESFLFLRGLKTLPLRMERHNENAIRIARVLEGHPGLEAVHYPGLEGHPGHEVARRQMNGFGGMLSIELAGGQEAAGRFLDSLQLFTQAVSLGDVASLACHPASTTHQLLPEPLLAQHGVTPGLVRLSIGIEDPEDLLSDIEQALAQASVEAVG